MNFRVVWIFEETTVLCVRTLGVANFYRDHVKNHSVFVRLQSNVETTQKPNKLEWSKEQEEAFDRIMKEINTCPLHFFLDEDS